MDMSALAKHMGHSERTQSQWYDRRKKETLAVNMVSEMERILHNKKSANTTPKKINRRPVIEESSEEGELAEEESQEPKKPENVVGTGKGCKESTEGEYTDAGTSKKEEYDKSRETEDKDSDKDSTTGSEKGMESEKSMGTKDDKENTESEAEKGVETEKSMGTKDDKENTEAEAEKGVEPDKYLEHSEYCVEVEDENSKTQADEKKEAGTQDDGRAEEFVDRSENTNVKHRDCSVVLKRCNPVNETQSDILDCEEKNLTASFFYKASSKVRPARSGSSFSSRYDDTDHDIMKELWRRNFRTQQPPTKSEIVETLELFPAAKERLLSKGTVQNLRMRMAYLITIKQTGV